VDIRSCQSAVLAGYKPGTLRKFITSFCRGGILPLFRSTSSDAFASSFLSEQLQNEVMNLRNVPGLTVGFLTAGSF
jgi:hypothetical protein